MTILTEEGVWVSSLPNIAGQIQHPGGDLIFPGWDMFVTGKVEFKVKTEELNSAAGDVENAVASMRTRVDAIAEKVRNTSGYWEGDAADDRRSKFAAKNDEIVQALERLRVYTQILQLISSNYAEAESENVESSQSLPTDVIS